MFFIKQLISRYCFSWLTFTKCQGSAWWLMWGNCVFIKVLTVVDLYINNSRNIWLLPTMPSFQSQGRPPIKKNVYFRALPKLPPPPPPLNSGNLVLSFRTSKTTFCAYYRKKYQRWQWWLNDKYDGDNGDFDDNDGRIWPENIQIL